MIGWSKHDERVLEKILESYDRLGYDAVNLTIDVLVWKGDRPLPHVPWVSANVVDIKTGAPLVVPFKILKAGKKRILVTGVEDPFLMKRFQKGQRSWNVLPPLPRVKHVLDQQKKHVDYVLVLAHLMPQNMNKLASELEGINRIYGSQFWGSIPHMKRVKTSICTVEQRGRMVVLDLFPSKEPVFYKYRLTRAFPDDPDIARWIEDKAEPSPRTSR